MKKGAVVLDLWGKIPKGVIIIYVRQIGGHKTPPKMGRVLQKHVHVVGGGGYKEHETFLHGICDLPVINNDQPLSMQSLSVR